jgi:hypothetical protein
MPSERTATATETPASVDYDHTPPGVNESGVNTLPLLTAHLEGLQGTSYAITVREMQRRGERSTTTSRVVRVGDSAASVVRSYSSNPVRSVAWTNGTTTVRRYTVPEPDTDARYEYNSSRLRLRQVTGQQRVLGLLTTTNFTAVDTVERNGSTVTTLASADTPGNETLRRWFGTTDVSTYRVGVTATEAGQITSLTLNATVGPSAQSTDVGYHYALSDVGTTTVERPDWLGTANQRATRLNATLPENASYLRVEHENGDAVPADAMVRWSSNPRTRPRTTELGVRIEPGDTVYASVTNGSVQFDRERPRNDTTEELASGLFLQFATQRGLPVATVSGIPSRSSENATDPTAGR